MSWEGIARQRVFNNFTCLTAIFVLSFFPSNSSLQCRLRWAYNARSGVWTFFIWIFPEGNVSDSGYTWICLSRSIHREDTSMPLILGLHFSDEKASLIVITGDDARIWLSHWFLTHIGFRYISLYRVKEMITFFSKTVAKRTPPGQRQSVQNEGTRTRSRENLQCISTFLPSDALSLPSILSLVLCLFCRILHSCLYEIRWLVRMCDMWRRVSCQGSFFCSDKNTGRFWCSKSELETR